MFEDRSSAGLRLAERLRAQGIQPDIVLAVPRGGLPLGRAVADEFDVPLDIVAAKKLGAPGNPEFAIGAAASDGSVWLNDEVIDRLSVPEEYVTAEQERAAATAREKVETYRSWDAPALTGERVVVVDDGVATGATIRACLAATRNAGAREVILAVPVGPPETLEKLENEGHTVVALERPTNFRAVGVHYRTFGQVSDEEAQTYLEDPRRE